MEELLVAEALRVNDRYLREVVLAFGLCPWAERALREGQVRRRVLTAPMAEPEAALEFVDELEAAGRGIEIGLLVLPRLDVPSPEFDRWAERLRQIDRARRPPGKLPDFVLAAFHPEAASTFRTPYQMVPFIRRTPDPTIQLVRNSTLEEARRTQRDLSNQIATQNFANVEAAGRQRLDDVLTDIRRDRDRAYAALGL